jgi:hypothetical protein
MEKVQGSKARHGPPARTAFVVHLTTVGGNEKASGADTLIGRVEHVPSGNSLRFASVRELVTFMRRAVATERAT